MRPRNPVACRITIGAPSPPQSRVCIRIPLTFTKLDAGSLNFELLIRGSIFSMSLGIDCQGMTCAMSSVRSRRALRAHALCD